MHKLRGVGKCFLTVECLLINVEGVVVLGKNHHCITIILKIGSGQNHQWMSNPGKKGERLTRTSVMAWPQSVSTKTDYYLQGKS